MNTLPLLAERLDILPGSKKPDVAFVSSEQDWLAPLLELTRRAYDLVLLDGGSGNVSAWTQVLLRQADLLVVCLPQNLLKLEQVFPTLEAQLLSNRKLLLVFGQYDLRSASTVKNVMRQFHRREHAYPIVHNAGWLDSTQQGDVVRWLFYKGKSIHLSFLSFGSEQELRRVCQNVYKYNFPGQLSEANGFKVNEMADGSRVVVLRPRFSESWAFFVRKFDVQNATLEQLIQDDNAELPIGLIRYLVLGERITAITEHKAAARQRS